MKKIFTILVSAAATLSVVSCDVTDIFSGKWLDVNSDPNAVSEVGNGLIIPAVELNLINIYGFYGHMMGSWGDLRVWTNGLPSATLSASAATLGGTP